MACSGYTELLDADRTICQIRRPIAAVPDRQTETTIRFAQESEALAMVESLDVFTTNGGSAEWLGCAETLKQALGVAVKHGEGSYFVFSQQTGRKSFYEVTSDGNIAVPSSPAHD